MKRHLTSRERIARSYGSVGSREIQGHPTSIFGKFLLGRRFEVENFRNIFCKIYCLPAYPRIFEHLKNGIIAHFNGFLPQKGHLEFSGAFFLAETSLGSTFDLNVAFHMCRIQCINYKNPYPYWIKNFSRD